MAAVLEQLPPALKDESAGKTIVRDVRVELREDSDGRAAAFVVLVLSDPPSDLEAWAVDDLWELRRKVREAIDRVTPELNLPWYVAFEPENPDLAED